MRETREREREAEWERVKLEDEHGRREMVSMNDKPGDHSKEDPTIRGELIEEKRTSNSI